MTCRGGPLRDGMRGRCAPASRHEAGQPDVRMLSLMTKVARWRAAAVLALFYAFCSVAPAAAFAFDAARAVHFLAGDDTRGLRTAQSDKSAATHDHADGTSHMHGKKADAGKPGQNGKSPDTKCCGLICLVALPANFANGDLPGLPRMSAVAAIEWYAAGQPPGRLDRPPN